MTTVQECLNKIKNPKYIELIQTIYNNNFMSKKTIKDVCAVTSLVEFLLATDHLTSNPYVTDIIYTASMLHNIKFKYKKDKFEKLFSIRSLIEETIKNNEEKFGQGEISKTCLKSLESTIEQQLGKNTPNEILIPNIGTPGYYLSLACALYYNYDK